MNWLLDRLETKKRKANREKLGTPAKTFSPSSPSWEKKKPSSRSKRLRQRRFSVTMNNLPNNSSSVRRAKSMAAHVNCIEEETESVVMEDDDNDVEELNEQQVELRRRLSNNSSVGGRRARPTSLGLADSPSSEKGRRFAHSMYNLNLISSRETSPARSPVSGSTPPSPTGKPKRKVSQGPLKNLTALLTKHNNLSSPTSEKKAKKKKGKKNKNKNSNLNLTPASEPDEEEEESLDSNSLGMDMEEEEEEEEALEGGDLAASGGEQTQNGKGRERRRRKRGFFPKVASLFLRSSRSR